MNADELPPKRPPDARMIKLLAGVGLMAGYLGVRWLLYRALPARNGFEWILRDAAMDIPRAIFLMIAWRFARSSWSPRELGMHAEKWRELLVMGALFVASAFVRHWMADMALLPKATALVLVSSSLLVGVFEELLFRGLLFRALFDQFGGRMAVIGSAALFVVFHGQAQPWERFPGLFAFGIFAGFARLQGASLPGLMILHAARDIPLVIWEAKNGYEPGLRHLVDFLIHAYLAAMYLLAYRVRVLGAK